MIKPMNSNTGSSMSSSKVHDANRLTPFEMLFGDICALQLVVQRLVAQEALRTGHPLHKVLAAEHAQASEELARMEIISDVPSRNRAILDHAQHVLDQIYATAGTTRPGRPGR